MNNTILVADDSPTELKLVLSALGKKGYQIVTATDGDGAIEEAKKHNPRLAIFDIIIPGKNGFQVTRALKTDAETSSMKVLLLSSKDQDSDKFWGMKQGADEYLTKPFDEDALLAAVARLF